MTMTRAEYDAECTYRRARHMAPEMPPWGIATWRERGMMVLAWIAALVISVAMFGAGLYVVGMGFERMVSDHVQRETCEKHAATPAEYHDCR